MIEAIGYFLGFAIGYSCKCKCNNGNNCEVYFLKNRNSMFEYINKLLNFSSNGNNSNAR